MQLHQLKPKAGATKSKKRLGRGNGSGHGTFSGRGCKGQGQRKSGNVRPGFEGGQTPLIKRLPKLRGFKNPLKAHYQLVNVQDLNAFQDGQEVSLPALLEKGLVSKKTVPVKLLGNGKLERKNLSVKLHKASSSARAKVLEAGGKML